MRYLFLAAVFAATSVHAWGPFETISVTEAPGKDWHWVMKTTQPNVTLELDCQSFLHHFHQNQDGVRKMSLFLETHECDEAQSRVHSCFPVPGRACVSDVGVILDVQCGPCTGVSLNAGLSKKL